MSIYGNPVMIWGGGGGGTEDPAIYGELFKYVLLSTDATDQFNRNDRYFRRNSNEPIIVLASSYFDASDAMSYNGYAAISFSSSGVTGTYNSYGDLTTPPQSAITPMGTSFYLQDMNGMYPTSVASNKLRLQYGNNRNNTLEFVIDATKIIRRASTTSITGDDDLIQALYALIDSVYIDYYA